MGGPRPLPSQPVRPTQPPRPQVPGYRPPAPRPAAPRPTGPRREQPARVQAPPAAAAPPPITRTITLAEGMTVLFVTHAITEAAYLAERAIVFSSRPARVAADVPLDLGRERGPALRTEASFARTTRVLFDALEQAGA